jgi:hypothetical protein
MRIQGGGRVRAEARTAKPPKTPPPSMTSHAKTLEPSTSRFSWQCCVGARWMEGNARRGGELRPHKRHSGPQTPDPAAQENTRTQPPDPPPKTQRWVAVSCGCWVSSAPGSPVGWRWAWEGRLSQQRKHIVTVLRSS